jgi:hypothetical protein
MADKKTKKKTDKMPQKKNSAALTSLPPKKKMNFLNVTCEETYTKV